MDKFNIDMPDDFEVKNQINIILDNGLESKQSFYLYIKDMYQKIGFENLFHDLSELVFIGMLFISILGFGIITTKRNQFITIEQIYTFIFVISPLFYLSTNLFSFINMKENNTYETEMICKYNLYQVSALRMLVFSIVSILLNIIFILALYNQINILRGIMISITSIFVFSAGILYSMVKMKSCIARYLVIGGWIIGNGVLIRISENHYLKLLENIPIAVYVIVTVIAVFIYIKNIQILSNYKKQAEYR